MTKFENTISKTFLLKTILTILISGTLYFFSTGLTGIGILVWFAPIAVLLMAFNSPASLVAIIAFISYFIGGLNLFSYLANQMPTPIVILVLALPALVFSLNILITRYVFLKFRHWLTIFIFPAAWASFEYLVSLLSVHGTYGNLAYTQTDFLPLMQLASITGLWGISFVLTLVPSAFAIAWQLRENRKQAALAILTTFILFTSVITWGLFRLSQKQEPLTLKVGLAVTDETIKYFRTDKANEAIPVVEDYAKRIDKLASQGAKIILLPEKFVGVAPDYVQEVYKIFAQTAQRNNVTVIAGFNYTGKDNPRNMAAVFLPSGDIKEYDKRHLLPAFESHYQPSKKTLLLDLEKSLAGIAICKDMDFSAPSSDYGKAKVGVMFIPAWDFVKDEKLHSRMAVVRAIENGFAEVRSAQEGLLTISDNRGRIIAEDSSSKAKEILLVGEVPITATRTLYNILGDWFAFLSLFLLLSALGSAIVKSKIETKA
ncbi:MAG: hypothetical protein HY819_05810 [Acidobacteria bacterium]|nr:hypothetical protein [Acidobacteriota bacterium]